MTKKTPKKKTHTTAWYKKKLWEVFTKYIKARDNNICITCGKYAVGLGMGGGHYKPAGACGLDYYFSEENVNAQCTKCNLILQGDQVNYREKLIKKYGIEVVEDIERNYHKPCKWSNNVFENRIAEMLRLLAKM